MKYIDKSVLRSAFDAYTKTFLLRRLQADGTFSISLASKKSWLDFSDQKYKRTAIPSGSPFSGWLDVLLREQEGRCCYCMRQLSPNEVSVEHLVPESFNGLDEEEEYAFYSEKAPSIRDYMMLGSQFDAMSREQRVEVNNLVKMPHLIAHSNLFPACSHECGCSCNNHRGNKRILPLMLMADVSEWLTYEEDGSLSLHYHDARLAAETIEHLDINTSTQCEIRRLWYLFSRIQVTPQIASEATPADRNRYLTTAFGLPTLMDLPEEYRKYFYEERYWTLFLRYNWFYDYYSNRFPVR